MDKQRDSEMGVSSSNSGRRPLTCFPHILLREAELTILHQGLPRLLRPFPVQVARCRSGDNSEATSPGAGGR